MRLRRLFSFLSVSLVGTVISGIRQGKTGRNSLLLVVQARVEEAVDEHAHQRRAELEGAGGEARGARLRKVLCDLHPWVRGQSMGTRPAENTLFILLYFSGLQQVEQAPAQVVGRVPRPARSAPARGSRTPCRSAPAPGSGPARPSDGAESTALVTSIQQGGANCSPPSTFWLAGQCPAVVLGSCANAVIAFLQDPLTLIMSTSLIK